MPAQLRLFTFDQDSRRWQSVDRDTKSDQAGDVVVDRVSTEESYLVIATSPDALGFCQVIFADDDQSYESSIALGRPLATKVRIETEAGQPIAAARLWTVSHTGPNGTTLLTPQTLETMGHAVAPSAANGDLQLPPLPPGKIEVRIVHQEFAPGKAAELPVGTSASIKLPAGVQLHLHVAMETGEKLPKSLVMDLRNDDFDAMSTLISQVPEIKSDGTAVVAVAAGKFTWFRLRHPDFVAVPTYMLRYGRSVADESEPFKISAGNDRFDFHLKRKVKVRGRVVDRETGKPVAKTTVQGEVNSGEQSGPFARFADEWMHADWAETDENGNYELKVAAGKARINFKGQELVADPPWQDVVAAADGSTVVPDLVTSPILKVRGLVVGTDGKPVPGAVVRFRGSMLTYAVNPVITDAEGRFELSPPWIPEDFQTHERLPAQTIVAFHPTEPLDARRTFDWMSPIRSET